ncbi:MAG: SMC-Scp complex subunit ScpB [Pirellulaceae bacterium]|nr:SMC-Scp complex subunit ScpB [Pirellulaceae bacterium]
MSRAPRDPEESGAENGQLGLEQFLAPADEQGLSLDALSRTYAQLLGSGADPYEPASDDAADAAAGDDQAESGADGGSEDSERFGAGGGGDGLPEVDGTCPVSPASILEAILFVGHPASQPLTNKQIAALMRGVSPREIDELVTELNASYDQQRAAFHIVSAGPGYRLELRPEMAPLRDKFLGRIKATRLSQQAIDVLAIVAYNQPVARDEVEQLRGRPVGGVLAQLVRRELLEVERDAERPRVPIYRTTQRFLELFGLASLEELPRSQEPDRAP